MGAILRDVVPDEDFFMEVLAALVVSGDKISDRHLWLSGPRHFQALRNQSLEMEILASAGNFLLVLSERNSA